MVWRIGDAGGVDREKEREERPGEVRGEAKDDGVVGGVGMVSLGLGRSEVGAVVVEDELVEERPGLRVEGDEGLSFGVAGFPVSDDSMAENFTTNTPVYFKSST